MFSDTEDFSEFPVTRRFVRLDTFDTIYREESSCCNVGDVSRRVSRDKDEHLVSPRVVWCSRIIIYFQRETVTRLELLYVRWIGSRHRGLLSSNSTPRHVLNQWLPTPDSTHEANREA